jgi:disulfide bond formation protein DsbB
MFSISNFNLIVAISVVFLQLLCVIAVLLLIFSKENKLLAFIKEHYVIIGFLITCMGALVSLVYSEIIHFIPCVLCWWQRVFVLPLVFIFGAAAWYKDRKVIKYVLPLLSVGFLISVYHNFNYYFAEAGSALPCDASGVSCYQHLVSVFNGYISIPSIALTGFISILVLLAVAHYYKKEN